MNKRQKKKQIKKIQKYIKENYDVMDENGNWKTIPVKCHNCQNYEWADWSVGLDEGCVADILYDENDEIIEKINEKIIFYMGILGYTCPYYKPKYKHINQTLKNVAISDNNINNIL